MRRTLYLLAVLLTSAASTAPAQLLVARIDTASDNPHGLLVHVSGLLDSPTWLGKLNNSFTIEMHWTVQLWRPGGFIDRSGPKTEWDTDVSAVPLLKQYVHVDRVPNKPDDRQTVTTIDSLKAWLGTERQLKGPKPLPPGDWYYTVDVTITELSQEQVDARLNNSSADDGNWLTALAQKFVLGTGASQVLQRQKVRFTVPKR
jgi:hypothetical protein